MAFRILVLDTDTGQLFDVPTPNGLLIKAEGPPSVPLSLTVDDLNVLDDATIGDLLTVGGNLVVTGTISSPAGNDVDISAPDGLEIDLGAAINPSASVTVKVTGFDILGIQYRDALNALVIESKHLSLRLIAPLDMVIQAQTGLMVAESATQQIYQVGGTTVMTLMPNKWGVFGASSVAQQLTNNTGAAAATQLVNVTTAGLADPAKCNANFSSLREALAPFGIIF